MQINDKGLRLLKSFEQCRLTAYLDAVGIPTIGWGHTGDDVTLNATITQQAADLLLQHDLNMFERGVEKSLTAKVNENQFSALVCFAYNVGLSALRSSTLLKLVNTGDFDAASQQFLRWNKAGGRVLNGLTRRREAERDLFTTA